MLYLTAIEDDSFFNSIIDTCDIIYAAYYNFHCSSNTLMKAALYRKPIIVSKGYLMAKRVERFRLGTSIPEDDSTAFLKSIKFIIENKDENGKKLKYGFQDYIDTHKLDNLKLALSNLLL
jgi:hypothetical protein